MTHDLPNVERRSSWRDGHLDCICGLANGRGGILEIGRNERDEAVGVTGHAGKAESAISQNTPRKPPERDQKTARNGHLPESAPLSKRILALLLWNPSASRREIAAALGTTRSKVRYRLDKLRKAGKIERIGPDKGGHWRVLGESVVEPDPTSERDPRNSR